MRRRPASLTPRLAALARSIRRGSRVADIGTDHGLLPLWLARTGRAAYCVATESSPARLERVARPPAGAAWAGRLDYRAGDGLAVLAAADRIDTIVVAGLGARAITRILERRRTSWPSIARLVLQPRSDEAALRAWLSARGWRPIGETLTVDRGRTHLTITAERGDDADLYRHPALSQADLLAVGPVLARTRPPELARLWGRHFRRWAELADGGSPRARAGLSRAERVLAAISRRAG